MAQGEKPTVAVVAALIWQNGTFLIGKRPRHKARGGLWEFVGGKVEQNETKEAALVRECREELGVTVAVDAPYMALTHTYDDIIVHLSLFSCHIEAGEPQLLEHETLAWIAPRDIEQYAFCPADVEILAQIKADFM